MFLTGFDATTLNTLWVDKDLKMHGLIQAFSRTNRILNSVKSFGNIVCFRNLEEKTNAAIALFGDKEAGGIVLLKSYDDYYNGYTDSKGKEQLGYKELVHILQSDFPLGQRLVGEQQEKAFIAQFGKLLRLRNILAAFDQFKGHEIISERDFQDYTGIYHDLHEKYVSLVDKKESILDDVVFELELVKQVEVNIDYILELVQKYHAKNNQDKELRSAIDSAIHSSLQLRSKKELIEKFIDHVNTGADIHEDWKAFVQKQCYDDAHALIDEENLTPGKAEQFLTDSLQNGSIRTTGTELTKVLPPTNIFDPKSQGQKERVIDKLKRFLDKYFGLIQNIDVLPYDEEPNSDEPLAKVATTHK
jgi:type I restriction enzyme R subunit